MPDRHDPIVPLSVHRSEFAKSQPRGIANMGLSCTVGGARGTFEPDFADEVAGLLDNAFGAENEWEGVPPRRFGDLDGLQFTELQRRAVESLGADEVPNLLALGHRGRGVYLPAHVQAVSLPLSLGEPLRCASLPGLRTELATLADLWDLPLLDAPLQALLHPDQGSLATPPEFIGYAHLALAANEAARRDCPLWLLG